MEAEVSRPKSVLAVLGHVDARSAALFVNSVLKLPDILQCYAALIGSCAAGGGSGSGDADAVTAGTINSLACLLDAVAMSTRPRLRCVPLLRTAGWTPERMAALDAPHLLLVLPPSPPPPPPSTAAAAGSALQPHPSGGGLQATPRAADPRQPHPRPHSHDRTDAEPLGGQQRPQQRGLHPQSSRQQPPPLYDSCDAEAAADELDRLRHGHLPGWVRQRVEAAAQGPGGGGGAVDFVRQEYQQCQPQADGGNGAARSVSSPPTAAADAAGAAVAAPADEPPSYVTLVDGTPADPAAPLRFGRVAVGGTFDRLHAGHELLLAATALVANGFVFVGVTADELLANKSHRELLQPYDKRAHEAVSYMQAVRPDLKVEAGPLRDPKAPTLAELDPSMEALVVSVETLQGAAAINAGRAARGFPPLTIVTVPVIGLRRGDPESAPTGGGAAAAAPAAGDGGGGDPKAAAAGPALANKLSSSGLRAMEAAEAAAAAKVEVAGAGAGADAAVGGKGSG